MNMWCLWNLGQMAERIYDKGTYIGAYLLCGVGGSIASLAWQPLAVTAGASGAIFGIAGLLITTFWMGNLAIPKEQTSSIMRSLLAFAGYNLLFGAAVPGISNSAHLGGLFTGLVLGGSMASTLGRGQQQSRGFRWLILAGASVVMGDTVPICEAEDHGGDDPVTLMHIRVLFFGVLKDLIGRAVEILDLPERSTLAIC